MPITPVITSATAALSITCPFAIGGTTYQQILQSMGSYVYGANFIYIAASTYSEITQAVFYNHFNAAGNQVQTYLPFSVDPYQHQPTLYYQTDDEDIVFDGFASLTINISQNSIVYLKFYMTIDYVGSPLDAKGDNAFKTFEKIEGIDFFDGYCDYLIDSEK